jgi:hypothetical protein
MATFTWYGKRTAGGTITIGGTDRIWFCGADFATKVFVGDYNDTTHVSNSSDAEQCTGGGGHLNNFKFIDSTHYSLNGGSSTALPINATTATIMINFAHTTGITCTNIKFYAYDGTTTTAAPTGVTFKAAEADNVSSAWVEAAGSGSALTFADREEGDNYDFDILLSASPTSVGLKTAFKLRMELTYS